MIVKNCPANYSFGCMAKKMNYKDCQKENNCIIKELINKYPKVKDILIVEEEN